MACVCLGEPVNMSTTFGSVAVLFVEGTGGEQKYTLGKKVLHTQMNMHRYILGKNG